MIQSHKNNICRCNSTGRVPSLQVGSFEFKSRHLHCGYSIMAITVDCGSTNVGSIPTGHINMAPSSSGLGHRPFTPTTRVRISLGSSIKEIVSVQIRHVILFDKSKNNTFFASVVELEYTSDLSSDA